MIKIIKSLARVLVCLILLSASFSYVIIGVYLMPEIMELDMVILPKVLFGIIYSLGILGGAILFNLIWMDFYFT